MVALWDLLLLLCVSASIGAGLAKAGIAHVGPRGYVIAVTVAVVLGLGCAWTMQVAARTAAARIQRQAASVHERGFRALYFAAMLWILISGAMATWVSSLVLRLLD